MAKRLEKQLDMLLIYPRTHIRENKPWSTISGKNSPRYVVPYGPVSLVTTLCENGLHARAIEMDSREGTQKTLQGLIKEYPPKHIGLSIMCDLQLGNSKEILEFLNSSHPEIPVTIGGQGATYYSNFFNKKHYNAKVTYQGWEPILQVINKPEEDVEGKGSSMVFSPADYSLFDFNSKIEDYEFHLPLSIGCFKKCKFCAGANYWEHKRIKRSSEDVVCEIERINDLGKKEIGFSDDNFRFNEFLMKISPGLKRFPSMKFAAMTRADTVLAQEKYLKESRSNNLEIIYLGIESGSQKVINDLGKKISINQSIEAVRILKKYDFQPRAFFMIGTPGALEEDDIKTLNLVGKLKKEGLDQGYVFHYRLLKGTPYEDDKRLKKIKEQEKMAGSGMKQEAMYDTINSKGEIIYSHERKDKIFQELNKLLSNDLLPDLKVGVSYESVRP